MPANKVTSFKWEIADFQKQRMKAYGKKESLISDVFTLVTHSPIQFALYYKPFCFWEDTYGVVLKKCDTDQPLNFDVKIWMENDMGQKFDEYSVKNFEFKTIGDQCGFNVNLFGNDWNLLISIFNNNKTMFICCELLDLNGRIVSTTDYGKEFLQNQLTFYEREMHDAVIKVGETEFKVSKFPLMCQSEVLERMFLSNFKEGVTGKIEVKDIDEETMKYFVKWFYAGKLEDESPVEKLFAAADKYDVKLLKKICTENMLNTLDNSNAFNRLILASIHSDTQLKAATPDFISKLPSADFAKFIGSDEWFDLGKKNEAVAREVGKLISDKMNA